MNIEARIKQNISLAPFTTFGIGGLAKYLIEIRLKEELEAIIFWCEENKVDYIILAGGSNVLVNDSGVDFLVIKITNRDVIFRGDRVECGAGASLTGIATKSFGNGLTGMEWAVGIPGSIGGATRGNAGAFGHSTSDNIETIEVYNTKLKKFDIYSKNISGFTYRSSIFKENKDLIIWSLILKLSKGNRAETDELIEKYTNHRLKSQPRLPSAGCVFKNILFEELKKSNPEIAKRAEEEGVVKGGMVGSGWLINRLDVRGKKIGGAKISLEHANFIVNTGGATASDVVMLISYIKQQVRDKLKVQLQEEIQYLGF